MANRDLDEKTIIDRNSSKVNDFRQQSEGWTSMTRHVSGRNASALKGAPMFRQLYVTNIATPPNW